MYKQEADGIVFNHLVEEGSTYLSVDGLLICVCEKRRV